MLPEASGSDRKFEKAVASAFHALDESQQYLSIAMQQGKDDFMNHPSLGYACGSMSVVRLHVIFKNPKRYGRFLNAELEELGNYLGATRNTAVHGGYRKMEDNIFWNTLEWDLPGLIDTLREEVTRQHQEYLARDGQPNEGLPPES